MADLTRSDVLKLAKLAKIELPEDETDQLKGELTSILEYVDKLSEVDVEGLEPATQVTGLVNATRADKAQNYDYSPQGLLDLTPSSQDGQIKVKRMIG